MKGEKKAKVFFSKRGGPKKRLWIWKITNAINCSRMTLQVIGSRIPEEMKCYNKELLNRGSFINHVDKVWGGILPTNVHITT